MWHEQVSVTLSGLATNCLGGTFNVVFNGGSGSLTPGTCTVNIPVGTHVISEVSGGAGFGTTAPTAVFKTGAQTRGCKVTSISGFSLTSGSVAATAPTTGTIDGCALGAVSPMWFSQATVTPARGTYQIPGVAVAIAKATCTPCTDIGSGYYADHPAVSVTSDMTCAMTFTPGYSTTTSGKINLQISGTSTGCIASPAGYSIILTYSGMAGVTPGFVTPAGTITYKFAPGTPTFSGGTGSTKTAGVGTCTVIGNPSVVTSGCDIVITCTAISSAISWTITPSGSGAGCRIGNYMVTFNTTGSGTSPNALTVNVPGNAAANSGTGLATFTGTLCDNLGANVVVLPTVTVPSQVSASLSPSLHRS